ncbi:dephospho-CoA kinase [uncultured Bacteroides sp.]|uniref:dephospho-CoA kinase n=1 Tax=uncultured Bacteroides sp. TaxID=162156 RepID=UPI0026227FBE|nr:dephospho-CoA kinase [uncultured Bacteroides sp.]
MKVRLGITGGIGSGKSFLSKLLIKKGIPVFDSDFEAKRLMLTDDEIIFSLKSLLGEHVYQDGEINKPLLASYIFTSAENASKVNSIVHPYVKNEFLKWADRYFLLGYNIVAIESAILFEAGFNDIVDKIVMVHAPLEIRVDRVIERDNTNREKVMERIKSQMDDDVKISMSDFVIENDGRFLLDSQVDKLISELQLIKDI